MRLKGPLADSYPSAVALVVCALIPYLALSTAITALLPVISKSLGMSKQSLELTTGMAKLSRTPPVGCTTVIVGTKALVASTTLTVAEASAPVVRRL